MRFSTAIQSFMNDALAHGLNAVIALDYIGLLHTQVFSRIETENERILSFISRWNELSITDITRIHSTVLNITKISR